MSTFSRRTAIWNGVKRISPFMVIAGPFGLIYGVTAADAEVGNLAAISASFIMLGGAAQIALMELIRDDATPLVAIATALVINLRFGLYSASLARPFAAFPRRFRFPFAAILSDQAAIVAINEYETEHDPHYRAWFYLGAAGIFLVPWWIGTVIGVLVGGDIGDAWQLPFAVPCTFLSLLVPSIRTRPALVAAVVGGGAAVGLSFLPSGVNIILGAFAGIAAGTIVSPLPSGEAAPT